MQDKTLYILRGVSGSGKSTLAETLANSLHHAKAVAADDYFYDSNGNYNFNAGLLGTAHNWCKARVQEMMFLEYSNIILHNTSTSDKEIETYLSLASAFEYKIVSLVVENRHGNSSVHNVPDSTLEKQRRRLLDSIKLI